MSAVSDLGVQETPRLRCDKAASVNQLGIVTTAEDIAVS